ncbi:sensor domain-containing protein [Mycolicibacterium brumae]|uniref:Sensor domain-containing protein n=1 Tax=Mycolicibacterium brumae TaxID=85968 RepID=A0A2G5PHQ3_9MYCO|nr:sensor domain-containing protein [Mycolicibacterium brumae]MCV7192437.1 sensor domain-containing protein [Mycolicibacterium brumae]PIB77553.1 sensor domain-containing protein [Mycolicibacterium brumae]UWW10205.1 sensor domain-containing protein [Mycolicibacterium brumae]
MRYPMALAAICLLLPGCANTTDGNAVRADDGGGPLETVTVPMATLPSLLLDDDAVSDIVGGSGVDLVATSPTLINDGVGVDKQQCVGAWNGGEQAGYQGSGYLSAAGALMRGGTTAADGMTVIQFVVGFTDAGGAQDYLEDSATAWAKCAGQEVIDTDTDSGVEVVAVLGELNRTDDGVITIVNSRRGADWACQRGLGAHRNVVIDTVVCAGGGDADSAADLVNEIAENIDGAII